MNLTNILAIALGGALGCVARYGVTLVPILAASRGWGTMAVNILGCLLIGIAATFLDSRGGGGQWRLLCITGFLGGFTTYSSFMLDAVGMMRDGEWSRVFTYLTVTLIGGFLAFTAGWTATEKLLRL